MSEERQRPPAEDLHADELRAARPSTTATAPAAGWRLSPGLGRRLRARRRPARDRAEVRRRARVRRALRGRAGHEPRADAHRRAGHREELAERAARRRDQRRLDADHPGQRRHHRGRDQVFVELRPAARRGAERALAGARAALLAACARARSCASRRSRAARSRCRTRCCRSSATACMAVPELEGEGAVAVRPQGFNVIATANTRDRGINEMCAALKRRFNFETVPADRRPRRRAGAGAARDRTGCWSGPASRCGCRRSSTETARHDLPRTAQRPDRRGQGDRAADDRDEYRRGGLRRLTPPACRRTTTARASRAPSTSSQHLVGTALKDEPEDVRRLRAYLEHEVRGRRERVWKDLYAARALLA